MLSLKKVSTSFGGRKVVGITCGQTSSMAVLENGEVESGSALNQRGSATLVEGSGAGSGSVPLTNGSGTGSWRPKKIRIRIHNTG
jgi:hypothetical protein